VKLRVRMMPTMTPSAISTVMRNVLLSGNSILSTPEPTVEITSLDAQAIEFELAFRVRDFASASAARNEVYDLIYRHARAAGLVLAQPKEAAGAYVSLSQAAAPVATRAAALRLVDTLPLLASLTEAEKQALAETMTRKTYQKGEVLVEEGGKLSSLMIIRTGVVVVFCHSEEGALELRRLAPGDYFGESSLIPSACETATVRALTFTVVYEVGQAALVKLIQDRPGIADEIKQTLSRRTKAGTSLAADGDSAANPPAVSVLASRIRRLFLKRRSPSDRALGARASP
jgi:CRP-like cAMP-binding protein